MLSGSKAYLFMNRDIEALELGHMAAQQLREAVSTSQDAQVSFTQSLTSTLTGLTDAQNNYLCASFLLGAEKGGDENRRIIRRTLITVYNRMALGHGKSETNYKISRSATRQPKGMTKLNLRRSSPLLLMIEKMPGGFSERYNYVCNGFCLRGRSEGR